MSERLTHLDKDGHAQMVDIGDKPQTVRHAAAACLIVMRPETLAMITAGTVPKGDVLAAARIAGIMAAKRTADLIPLCHPLSLSRASVALTPTPDGIAVRVDVETTDRTGVEMEALTAASIAALTIYDMCKAADRAMRIDNLRVIEKSGGRSGAFSQP
jgi:cyclic pyranopterin phosphate synthase